MVKKEIYHLYSNMMIPFLGNIYIKQGSTKYCLQNNITSKYYVGFHLKKFLAEHPKMIKYKISLETFLEREFFFISQQYSFSLSSYIVWRHRMIDECALKLTATKKYFSHIEENYDSLFVCEIEDFSRLQFCVIMLRNDFSLEKYIAFHLKKFIIRNPKIEKHWIDVFIHAWTKDYSNIKIQGGISFTIYYIKQKSIENLTPVKETSDEEIFYNYMLLFDIIEI